jgi:hypothetical protein
MPFSFDFAKSWELSQLSSPLKLDKLHHQIFSYAQKQYQEQEQDGEEKDCKKSMICEMKKINLGWVMNPIYIKKKTKR